MNKPHQISQLNHTLGELVANPMRIEKFIRNAGLKPEAINLQGTALDIWSDTINEANKLGKVEDVVRVVLEDYPDNPFLKSALNQEDVNYSLSPDLDKIATWESIETETLEKLTQSFSTLLPISFLEKGIEQSKSVAKVAISRGRQTDAGTGFLFKLAGIDKLLFMTNFHVISNREDIGKTSLFFDYELNIDGTTKESKRYEIIEEGLWITSPVDELDCTVFEIKDNDKTLSKFSYLNLDKIEVLRNDFVNIIQHPAGEHKQISLYHNIVTNVKENRIQYLTDTMAGSSGSPVFNSNWDVVGLHHSGGKRREHEPELPENTRYRNQGVRMNDIIDFLHTKI